MSLGTVIRAGADEARASVQANVRRHRSARTETGTRADAARAPSFLWIDRTSGRQVDSTLPGVLRRAVPEESCRCWRRARPAPPARQGCRIRRGQRLCLHEALSLERAAFPSRLAVES